METVYDPALPILERIKIPMVWERLAIDVRVEDLVPKRYDDALGLVKTYFIEDDPMCKGLHLEKDEDAVKEFLDLVVFWMQDTQSFVAVEESTGTTIGVLIGRVNEKDAFSRAMSCTRIYKTELMGKMQRFLCHLHKQFDIYQTFNITGYYKLHVWCVHPDYRDRGIGKALLRTAVDQTNQFKMAAICGTFTSAVTQHIARSMGFQSQLEVLYWQWKENEEPVFDNPGAGNSSANLMVKLLEVPVEHGSLETEQNKQGHP